MAKIIITIEDTESGNVKITSTPNFETMMKMDVSGETFTSAMGYAFALLNHAWKLGKKKSPIIREIPKLRF